ncbi:uncharacterized protein LOC113794475 isoform X2 [Dermatophagoides pteronyssinus]|uniref:Uncharacterized protein LOC113794475 n=1 Tax=Dermatophagoides pteronyssinus TaxID=6956 RepID=A0A6P6Y4I2_DERPT|nr:uncharacterized protein LOC113794475 [Dermatophagoides pteronyssinus]
MPTYDDRKKTVNYYGVFTLWASLLLLASYFSLFTSGCKQVATMEIQISLAVAFVSGILIFLLSFCNIASRLYHSKFSFYLIVITLLALSTLLIYQSYQTWNHECKIGRYYERNNQLFDNMTVKKDEFEKTLLAISKKRNNHYNVSALLDLIAAILFMASAYAFRYRF